MARANVHAQPPVPGCKRLVGILHQEHGRRTCGRIWGDALDYHRYGFGGYGYESIGFFQRRYFCVVPGVGELPAFGFGIDRNRDALDREHHQQREHPDDAGQNLQAWKAILECVGQYGLSGTDTAPQK